MEGGIQQSTKHRAQRLSMHGVNMMLAVFPGVSMNVSWTHRRLHHDEKRLCKNPTPRIMPDYPHFSYPQQRINKPHVASCVGPFHVTNIAGIYLFRARWILSVPSP
jgi:hypothetical protein